MTEGLRLLSQRRYEQALQAFREEDGDPAENPELSYYIGLCYTHLGRFDEALLHLEQVLDSGLSLPHIYQSRMILGYIYAVTRRYRLAEFEFNALVQEGFESPKEYAALGYVLYAQDRIDEAVKALERALELDPNNANALNSLGFILAQQQTRPQDALEYCRKAVQLRPQNAAYLDSLGWAQFVNGKTDEARRTLRKALELDENNKDIASHLRAVMEAAHA